MWRSQEGCGGVDKFWYSVARWDEGVEYSYFGVHCYKTDGEIPVHIHDDARRQRSTTGKYFPYESGVNTCFAPGDFNTSGIFPRYCMKK